MVRKQQWRAVLRNALNRLRTESMARVSIGMEGKRGSGKNGICHTLHGAEKGHQAIAKVSLMEVEQRRLMMFTSCVVFDRPTDSKPCKFCGMRNRPSVNGTTDGASPEPAAIWMACFWTNPAKQHWMPGTKGASVRTG